MTTSLTLAAAPTVCTGPLPASTPLWALWPECQFRPFRAWRASGSLPPFAFLAELGASANAASAIEPPPADLQGRGGVGNLVAEPEGHAREFKEGSGAADRVSRPFAREVGPRLQKAHAQQGWPRPSGAGTPALGRALAGSLRASARVVRRSMECLSPDLAVSPIRPSSAARFASLRPRRDGVRRGLRAPVVGGSPGSGNALLAGLRPRKMG